MIGMPGRKSVAASDCKLLNVQFILRPSRASTKRFVLIKHVFMHIKHGVH